MRAPYSSRHTKARIYDPPPPSRNSQGIPFVCFKKRKHSICCTSLHHLLNSFMRLFRNGSALLSLLQKPAASSTSSTYARLPNVEQYYHHCWTIECCTTQRLLKSSGSFCYTIFLCLSFTRHRIPLIAHFISSSSTAVFILWVVSDWFSV